MWKSKRSKLNDKQFIWINLLIICGLLFTYYQIRNVCRSHKRLTTFLWNSLSLSMYLCVVCRDERPTIIWMSLKDPPTIEIFFDVSVITFFDRYEMNIQSNLTFRTISETYLRWIEVMLILNVQFWRSMRFGDQNQ